MFQRIFLDHPATVNESFLQHMRFALGFAGLLLAAGAAALVHALIPCFFEKTAGNVVRKLHHRIENRH